MFVKLKRKVYETTTEKRCDFWIGFGGCFLVNVVLGALLVGLSGPLAVLAGRALPGDGTMIFVIGVAIQYGLPLVINVLALIYLGITRQRMALDALAAMGIALLVALVAPAACFVNLA